MENANTRDTSALIILAIFMVPVMLWYLGYLWVLTKDWLNKVDNLNNDVSRYNYTNKLVKESKHIQRERPPNASFFCRIDGKETWMEGPYEEKFLTRIEKIKWECKKRRRKNKKIV